MNPTIRALLGASVAMIGFALHSSVAYGGDEPPLGVMAIRFADPRGGENPRAGITSQERKAIEELLGSSVEPAGHTVDGAVLLELSRQVSSEVARDLGLRIHQIPGVLYATMTRGEAVRLSRAAVGPILRADKIATTESTVSQLIVRLKREAYAADSRSVFELNPAVLARLSAAAGEAFRLKRVMHERTFILDLGRETSQVQARAMASRLEAISEVEFAEPDIRIFQATGALGGPGEGSTSVGSGMGLLGLGGGCSFCLPSEWAFDPFSIQWNLVTRGMQVCFNGSCAALTPNGIQMVGAWDLSIGNPGVVIAVIDSGILFSHPDLRDRVLPGYDFISDPSLSGDGDGRDSNAADPGGYGSGCANGTPTTPWHGTHVAGIIGARSDGAGIGGASSILPVGIAGIDWTSSILPVRAIGPCGGVASDIANAIKWAAGIPVPGVPANPSPASVINISLGGNAPSCPAIFQDAINAALSRGVAIVVAAGNSNEDALNFAPANCAGVMSVAATTIDGTRAPYSNFGPSVDFSAPGGDCEQCDRGIRSTNNDGVATPGNHTYKTLQGTSFAAPHVTGAISLMLGVKKLAPFQLYALLARSSVPVAGCTGCGHGRIDVWGSMQNLSLGSVQTSGVGSLDTTFGEGGFSVLPMKSESLAIALDASSRVLSAGKTYQDPQGAYPAGFDTLLVRHNADGTLDTTFNSVGYRHYDMSVLCNGAPGTSYPQAIVVQPDNKMIVAAYTQPLNGPCIARFNPDGSLDATFGAAGVASIAVSGYSDGVVLALQSDAKIVALAQTCVGSQVHMLRLLPNGTPDPAFGSNGVAMSPADVSECSSTGSRSEMALDVASDGKLIVAGVQGAFTDVLRSGLWIRRFNPDGSRDTSFGSTGRFAVASSAIRSGAYLLNRMRVKAGPLGTVFYVSGALLQCAGCQSDGVVVLKLNNSGQLDSSFKESGFVAMALDDPSPTAAGPWSPTNGVFIQTSGKILAVSDKLAIRLTGGGDPDGSFGVGGTLPLLPIGLGNAASNSAIAGSTGAMITGMRYEAFADGIGRLAIARYLVGEVDVTTACYINPVTQLCDSTGSLGLGDRVVGSLGAPMNATFTNSGTQPLAISSIIAIGRQAEADFFTDSNTCGATLAAGASCNISVNFSPRGTGARTGALYFNGENARTNVAMLLQGTGVAGPVVRYRLYSPGTFEHLYTTDLNEYNVLPMCCAWVAESAIYRIFNGPTSFSGVTAVPYYRLYNPFSHQHHWTSDLNEYSVLPSLGWVQEGTDGFILPAQAAGTLALYRLYLGAHGGLHLWTTDPNEVSYLTGNAGWVSEGIAGYVLPLQ